MKPRYKIGMRTIKTVVAVGICLATFQLLNLGDTINGVQAALAAVICMKSSLQHSLRTGVDRTLGTIIGSVTGVLLLFTTADAPPIVWYFASVFGVLFTIYLCNILKLLASVPISVVVFLIIFVTKQDASPLYYGIARLTETVYGIFIAYMTNRFLKLPIRKAVVNSENISIDGIRRAYDEEIGNVMSIWLSTAISAHPFLDSSYWHNIYEQTREAFKAADWLVVYASKERILGFICFSDEGNILGLCVEPKEQRAGIGTSLIDYAKSKISCLSIGVFKRNDTVIKFLLNRGFFAEIQKAGEYILEWSDKNKQCIRPQE